MANIRLTKSMREEAIGDALREVFKQQMDKNVAACTEVALAAYRDEFGKEVQAMQNVDESKWLKHVTSVNFIVFAADGKTEKDFYFFGTGDYTSKRGVEKEFENCEIVRDFLSYEFKTASNVKIGTSLPVPYSNGGYVHIQKESQLKKINKLREERNALIKEIFIFYNKLSGFLAACKNVADVQTNWPEGAKYFPTEPEVKENLPIPLIDDIRQKMKAVKSK